MLRSTAVRILILQALAGLLFGCGAALVRVEPKSAPLTRVTLWDGEYVSLNRWENQTVVLGFWASWCRASRRRVPELAAAARKFKDNRQLVFLAVNVDKFDQRAAVADLIESPDYSGPIYAFSGNDSNDEAYASFQPPQLPYFYVIDGQRRIQAQGGGLGPLAELLGELKAAAPK
jgi:thiol-disulfide isomerase/thioredoxin